jgi:cytochrome o ubiquinol oxidase subunit 2
MQRGLFVALLIGAAALSGCSEGILDPKGPIAAAELEILLNSLGIMLAIVIPTILATLGVAYWYRSSNHRARYQPEFAYSSRLEMLVWSIPAMTVLVVSLDWKWLFIYPEHGIATVNQLVVPVGTPVSFELTSSGVMNSFFVPQLGSQIYTMAGMTTRLHLQADHAGTYRGLSANFSGDGFADMRFAVDAVSPGEFERWVQAVSGATSAVLDAAAYAGLAKPSRALPPQTYRAVAPGLFDSIVNAGPRGHHVSSQRTEK